MSLSNGVSDAKFTPQKIKTHKKQQQQQPNNNKTNNQNNDKKIGLL